MEEITLTIEEILEGRRLVTMQEIRQKTGKKGNLGTRDLVNVTKEGKVREDSTIRWYHFEMEGTSCVYAFPEKKFKKAAERIKAPALTLEEALEGRRQVTLDEVREQRKKQWAHALRDMAKITAEGITKDGLFCWYHFEIDGMPCVHIRKRAKICKENKMTEKERKFAEDHIKLFYKFFCLYGFREEECYDAALWAYLLSVVKYSRDKKLKKYEFSTIAYKAMYGKCIVKKKRILEEQAKMTSLEKMREEIKEDGLLYRYIKRNEPDKDRFKEVMEDIAPYINAQQKKFLSLLHAGYGFGEIQNICGWSLRKERTIRNGIIETAKSYYSKAI